MLLPEAIQDPSADTGGASLGVRYGLMRSRQASIDEALVVVIPPHSFTRDDGVQLPWGVAVLTRVLEAVLCGVRFAEPVNY